MSEVSSHGPILVHCYAESDTNPVEILHVAFNDTESPFYTHPSVLKLHEMLNLKYYSGYVSLIKPYKLSDSSDNSDSIDFDDWIFFDLRFGIPLFDKKLNSRILNLFKKNKQGSLANLNKMLEANRGLTLKLIDFIQMYQTINIIDETSANSGSIGSGIGNQKQQVNGTDDEYLIRKLFSLSPIKKHSTSNMVIYPTQCVLYQDGKIRVYQDED